MSILIIAIIEIFVIVPFKTIMKFHFGNISCRYFLICQVSCQILTAFLALLSYPNSFRNSKTVLIYSHHFYRNILAGFRRFCVHTSWAPAVNLTIFLFSKAIPFHEHSSFASTKILNFFVNIFGALALLWRGPKRIVGLSGSNSFSYKRRLSTLFNRCSSLRYYLYLLFNIIVKIKRITSFFRTDLSSIWWYLNKQPNEFVLILDSRIPDFAKHTMQI